MNDAFFSTLRCVLAAPWQQRRNRRGLWMVLLIAALCASAPVVLFAWSLFENPELAAALRHSAAVSGRIAVVALLVAWWAVIVANVLEQNHPTLARLVPHHPAQLRVALLAGAAALVAFASLVLYTDVPDALACVTGAAIVLAVLAAAVRWPWLWIFAWVVPWVAASASSWPALLDAITSTLRQWHGQRLSIATTVLAAAIVLLAVLIQDGGRRHAANYEARCNRMLRMQAAVRGERSPRPRRRGSLRDLLHSPYHAWLQHVLASSRGSPRARAMLGLGPGVHWTCVAIAFVVTVVGILCGVVLLELVALVFPALRGLVPVILSSVAIGTMFGIVSPAMQVQARLHQTQREQALLALLPGMPRGAVSNRWLGWRMSAQFLLAWVAALASMLLFSELARHLGRPTVDVSYGDARALMVLATLPLVTLQWRRWARLPAPTSLNAGWPSLLGLGLAAVAFIGQAAAWFTFAQAGTAFALAAAAWCALCWWRMDGEPSAFPVGRRA